jgi:FPC/CPF motif-containing protein YcgG
MRQAPDARDAGLQQRFRKFIHAPRFSCVGAKAALSRGRLSTVVARDITSAWNDLEIHRTLLDFVRQYRRQPGPFRSLAVIFRGPLDLSEKEFERHLWERLQSLSDKDAWRGQRYDPRVSPHPDNPHFAVSFGGEGFFIVGLHPHATRPARRFETPVMVFNLHDQFERLRAAGTYEKLRRTIIERDVALAGSPNPMLARFGERSEAAQYSGRMVDEGWVCPFNPPAAAP